VSGTQRKLNMGSTNAQFVFVDLDIQDINFQNGSPVALATTNCGNFYDCTNFATTTAAHIHHVDRQRRRPQMEHDGQLVVGGRAGWFDVLFTGTTGNAALPCSIDVPVSVAGLSITSYTGTISNDGNQPINVTGAFEMDSGTLLPAPAWGRRP